MRLNSVIVEDWIDYLLDYYFNDKATRANGQEDLFEARNKK